MKEGANGDGSNASNLQDETKRGAILHSLAALVILVTFWASVHMTVRFYSQAGITSDVSDKEFFTFLGFFVASRLRCFETKSIRDLLLLVLWGVLIVSMFAWGYRILPG